MSRRADVLCAGTCGNMIWGGTTSLPEGLAKCRECRARDRVRACGYCGKDFSAVGVARQHKTCSMECAKALAILGRQRSWDLVCGCGTAFVAGTPKAKYCDTCHDVKKSERNHFKSYRNRASYPRGTKADRINRDVVGDRDGWRCGICGRKVNATKAYPHPKSPSVDHVVPVSQGGEHTYANVRITHLSCNHLRGNRGGNEQLALIG